MQLNKVLLAGNLTRDPELRYTPQGTAVCTMSLALNRNYKSGEGSKQEVCYVRVVAWAKLAEICGQYLAKGRPVFIEGRLQSRSWQTQDGSKRNTLEVVAVNIQFLGSKPKPEPEKEPEIEMTAEEFVNNDDSVPF